MLQPLIQLNRRSLWRKSVRVWGCQVSADSLDRVIYLHLHRFGWMGAHEKHFLEQTIRPGMRVVDVGANIGLYTLLLSRLVGNSGTVVSLEPDPDLFAVLSTNCCVNEARNVELHNVAAGSQSGRLMLARSLVNAGDNRLVSADMPPLTTGIEVPVAPLDEIVRNRPVDFVKIDVQGWESRVFGGMHDVLSANGAIQVLFEYWPHGLRKAGCEPARLLDDLTGLGFHLYEFSGSRRVPISDLPGWHGPTGWKFTNLHAVRGPLAEP